jgi:hypothetical protein
VEGKCYLVKKVGTCNLGSQLMREYGPRRRWLDVRNRHSCLLLVGTRCTAPLRLSNVCASFKRNKEKRNKEKRKKNKENEENKQKKEEKKKKKKKEEKKKTDTLPSRRHHPQEEGHSEPLQPQAAHRQQAQRKPAQGLRVRA